MQLKWGFHSSARLNSFTQRYPEACKKMTISQPHPLPLHKPRERYLFGKSRIPDQQPLLLRKDMVIIISISHVRALRTLSCRHRCNIMTIIPKHQKLGWLIHRGKMAIFKKMVCARYHHYVVAEWWFVTCEIHKAQNYSFFIFSIFACFLSNSKADA